MASNLLNRLLGDDSTRPNDEITPDTPVAPDPPRHTSIIQVTDIIESGGQAWVERCCSGQIVILTHELTHPTESNAIGVWLQTDKGLHQLGYVHPAATYELATKMEQGWLVEATVNQVTGVALDKTIALAIEVTVVPTG